MIGFAGILVGMFTIGVMQLILAAALPSIVAEIGGGEAYSWVFSSYMLASLATIPLFSKLADIYGKRRFFILGMCIFAGGSILGGLAPVMSQLITARVIQGLGAGIITPVAMAMITDLFPPEKRGSMIGVFGFVQLLSNLLSPPLGGYITKQLGWHWLFFLTTVMVSLSVFLVMLGSRQQESKADMRFSEIDVFGGLIFGGFCMLTVGFTSLISKQSSWTLSSFLLLLAVVAAGIVLIILERQHKNPVIKMEFLKTKLIRASILSSILTGALMYGLISILPLCGAVLRKQGFQVDESRILLFFMLGITLGLLICSRITRLIKTRNLTKYIWIIQSVSSILMLYSIHAGSLTAFGALSVLVGFCTGGIMATFLINSQNAINSQDRTVLSGLIQLGRYFGASLGVTLLAGMLPEISAIRSIGQFVGAFGLIVALCVAGLVNELV